MMDSQQNTPTSVQEPATYTVTNEVFNHLGDPSRIACLYFDKIIKRLDENPEMDMSALVDPQVDLVNLFLRIHRGHQLPCTNGQHMSDIFLRVHMNKRLVTYMTRLVANSLEFLRAQSVVLYRLPVELSVAELPEFLRLKRERIAHKQDKLARLVKDRELLSVQTKLAFSEHVAKMKFNVMDWFVNPHNRQSQAFAKVLAACESLGDGALKMEWMKAMLRFYTPEKIREIQRNMASMQRTKETLEKEVAAASRQKRIYDNLGPEFKQLARVYGGLLHDIRIENQVMNAESSP